MNGKEKQMAAYNEFERIQRNIESIIDFNHIAPTYKWIKQFDKIFGYAELTGYLITRLNDKQLN
jgi:hypothetical protein